MNILGRTLVAAAIAAGVFGAAPASASSWQIYDAGTWSSNGNVNVVGPTTVVVANTPEPCSPVNMGFTLAGGQFKLVSMSFAGSSACAGITVSGLPATISGPTAVAGSAAVNFTIDPIVLKFSFPATTCTFRIKGTLANANPNSGPSNNTLTFTADNVQPSPCTNFKSNPSMSSGKPVRALFP